MELGYADLPRRKVVSSPYLEKCINSYGIVTTCTTTNRWLLVKGRHTFTFRYILYGFYQPVHIAQLLQYLTQDEVRSFKYIAESCNLEEARSRYAELYAKVNEKEPSSFYAFERLYDIRDDFLKYEEHVNPTTLPFSIPMGRARYREDTIETAIREFKEETGFEIVDKVDPRPIRLETQAVTDKKYNIKCWLYCIEKEFDLENSTTFDTDEISERRWIYLDLDNTPSSISLKECSYVKLSTEDDIYLDVETVKICKIALQRVKSQSSSSVSHGSSPINQSQTSDSSGTSKQEKSDHSLT